MTITPEHLEAIKDRATDLLLEINPEVDRGAVRNTVDLYVRVLDKASMEVLDQHTHLMTHDEMVAHDAAVGLPGWTRVQS